MNIGLSPLPDNAWSRTTESYIAGKKIIGLIVLKDNAELLHVSIH